MMREVAAEPEYVFGFNLHRFNLSYVNTSDINTGYIDSMSI